MKLETLTVATLRERLAGLPDDMPVLIVKNESHIAKDPSSAHGISGYILVKELDTTGIWKNPQAFCLVEGAKTRTLISRQAT